MTLLGTLPRVLAVPPQCPVGRVENTLQHGFSFPGGPDVPWLSRGWRISAWGQGAAICRLGTCCPALTMLPSPTLPINMDRSGFEANFFLPWYQCPFLPLLKRWC